MALAKRDTEPLLAYTTQPIYASITGTSSRPSSLQQTQLGGDVAQENLENERAFRESFNDIPTENRDLGTFTVVFLVFNRAVGTGIFATPSVILRASGSVGVALLMWLIGALIAAAGTAVYIELGSGLPRNGGDKNYLEFIYRRPKFLVTCIFAVYTLITGSSVANSVVFDVAHLLSLDPSAGNPLFLAWSALSFSLLVHGTARNFGLAVQNSLGFSKLIILCTIILSGLCCSFGVPGFAVKDEYEKPKNLKWDNLWEGTGTGLNAFIFGLYSIIWSYTGYTGANYALSEVKDPVRALKRAVPLAMLLVATIYMLINIAYFSVVSKNDILKSRRIVAAPFFRNLYGPMTEKVVSGFIALSVLGNILAVQFSQGRGEGILSYSSFFASNKPFNTPLAGLVTQYIVSCVFMTLPPPRDAYLFMLSLSSYCTAIVQMFIAYGLLLLYVPAFQKWNWNPPFRAPKPAIVIFCLVNVFLIFVPLIPPSHGSKMYDHLPYWSHILVAYLVSLLGIAYWYRRCVWLPRRKGYKVKRTWAVQDDGMPRYIFQNVPGEASAM